MCSYVCGEGGDHQGSGTGRRRFRRRRFSLSWEVRLEVTSTWVVLGVSPSDGGAQRSRRRTAPGSPRALQTQTSCGCHQAVVGDPRGPKGCAGRSLPSPPQAWHQPWLSPPSPGQTPCASATRAQAAPRVMLAVLSHAFVARGGIPTHKAARGARLHPRGSP